MGFDKEQMKQDVRAVEHAKTDDIAREAALLLRNDVGHAHSQKEKRAMLDLVHRTNVYDRAENADLPKVTLVHDKEAPEFITSTVIDYKDHKLLEGDLEYDRRAKQ